MYLCLGLVLVSVLPGCAEFNQAADTYTDTRVKQNDVTLDLALRYICHGASVGALQRLLGDDAERIAAYNRLCGHDGESPVLQNG